MAQTSNDEKEKVVFHAAWSIMDAAQRETYLEAACEGDRELRKRVDSLLSAADNSGGFLKSPPIDTDVTVEKPACSEAVGTTIGPYKLLEKIGEGGFGVVYMVDQLVPIQRRVALKIIKAGMDTKQVIARFEAERQALALMDHPNIAKVLDAGATEAGRPYFVMELVRGVPVTEYCDDRTLATEHRLSIFLEICSAIQHAHQKGIIHRDIKSSNVLVSTNGDRPVPKVIDFGIAKATQGRLTEKTLFTQFRQLIGTPAYMSPEQAQMSAVDIDTRSDIYSLGVLLYELLTGTTPLDSKDFLKAGFDEVCRHIREEEPPNPSIRLSSLTLDEQTAIARFRRTEPEHLRQLIRVDLDWIVMKAMEKDRTRRYETANALKLDVERFLRNEPVSAVAPSTSYKISKFLRRHRSAVSVAALVTVLLIAATAVSIGQGIRASQQAKIANEKTQQAIRARNAALDSKRAAETAREQEKEQRVRTEKLKYASDMKLAQAAVQHADVKLVREILDAHRPNEDELDMRGWEWRYLYGQLHQEQAVVRTHGRIDEIAVSPDGQRLAVSGNRRGEGKTIQILDSSNMNVLRTLEHPGGWVGGMWFSRDNGTLIVERGARAGVLQYDLDGGQPTQLLRKGARPLTLSPDSKYLIGMYQAKDDHRASKYLRCFDAKSDQDTATTGSYLVPNPWMLDHELRLSPNGKLVTLSCAGHKLRVFSLPDLTEVVVVNVPGEVSAVAWSPDSKFLATGYDYPWFVDLWEVPSGQHVKNITGAQTSPCLDICFSPDGSLLAFSEYKNQIHVWETEESVNRRVLPGHSGKAFAIKFFPHGDILASGAEDGTVKLWDVSAPATSELRDASEQYQLRNIEYSPDGKMLAAAATDGIVRLFDSRTEKLIKTISSGSTALTRRPLGEPESGIRFSGDGQTLLVDNNDDIVRVFDVPSGEHRLDLQHSGLVLGHSISPDGAMIAAAGGELTFWNANTGVEEFSIAEDYPIDVVEFSPDPKSRLVAFSGKDEMSLMHVDSKERRSVPVKYTYSLSFSQDGKVLACGLDGQVELFEIPSLKPFETLKGSRGPVPNVSFSSDGMTLAIPNLGGFVQLWNRQVSAEVGRLPLPTDSMTAAIFSPDSSMLAVSTLGNGVYVFRVPTFEQITARHSREQSGAASP